ncbi:MAG: aminotransferase class V-fold PLP-dependent enzyme [Myxococcaceae bacterium]|nr:aminotransferase class V-fold PLP-dependent enzyme [Myxococcaceae bacterium]MCA3014685.1 aminotransferase class V-fold PLP-dependent enzyme [Myxococcaceae bacterium]
MSHVPSDDEPQPGSTSPLTPEALRASFPALQEWTWLNAAASSPLCTPVVEAMERVVDASRRRGDLDFSRWLAQRDVARAKLARFVGARPEAVAFTPSTSFGFHVVARCLSARGITEVLSLEHEFPSTTVPLLHAGLTIRGVRRRPDGSYPLADVEAALRPTTGAVAVSLVQFNSGFRVDVEGLAALCHARGLALCLNGAQAIGHTPIDVTHWGADFLAMTSHKWLGAGYGTGMLVVAERWREALPMAGWLSVPPAQLWQAFPGAARTDDAAGFVATGAATRGDASVLEGGGASWVGWHALEAALDLHQRLPPGATLMHVHGLQAHLRAGLRARGFVPTAPDAPDVSSGICVVPVAGSADDVVRALVREAKVVTTARGGGVRLSTHVFNTLDDVDRALWAFDRLGVRPG